MDEVPAFLKEAPSIHSDIPGDLFHPGFIGMWRNPGNLNATALKLDKEQHVVRRRPAQRQYFHREKVSARKDGHVRANELCPGCPTLPCWRRRDAMALQNIANRWIG